MDIGEYLQKAREISAWLHGKVENSSLPTDKRTLMAVAVFQQVLDITDGIVILLETNYPGPALALARSMHEGYIIGVWLLKHASEESVENFEKRICPKIPTLIKEIGDDAETGGEFIKGMTELNISDFHNLTHGGMEHVKRRVSGSTIEPNYNEEELIRLIKIRNHYSMLITWFLVMLVNDKDAMKELLQKREEWNDVLL